MTIAPPHPSNTRLGWIGLGVMGNSMASNLLDAGYSMTVFTRTRSSADTVVSKGATWAESPAAVAAVSDITFSIVGFPEDVREVMFGEVGVVAAAEPGSVIVDMTTSEPALAVEIATLAETRGIAAVDAPVSGGDVGARQGTLSIMIGGDAEVVASLDPVWSVLGSNAVHQGPPGSGQHTKMVNQTLIAGAMIGVCEALLYAHGAGLDAESVLKSVGSGAAGSWSLTNLGTRIIDDNFEPGFYVEHFVKDMTIALAEAERMSLELPGLQLVRGLYARMVEQGQGRLGTQALYLALSDLAEHHDR